MSTEGLHPFINSTGEQVENVFTLHYHLDSPDNLYNLAIERSQARVVFIDGAYYRSDGEEWYPEHEVVRTDPDVKFRVQAAERVLKLLSPEQAARNIKYRLGSTPVAGRTPYPDSEVEMRLAQVRGEIDDSNPPNNT